MDCDPGPIVAIAEVSDAPDHEPPAGSRPKRRRFSKGKQRRSFAAFGFPRAVILTLSAAKRKDLRLFLVTADASRMRIRWHGCTKAAISPTSWQAAAILFISEWAICTNAFFNINGRSTTASRHAITAIASFDLSGIKTCTRPFVGEGAQRVAAVKEGSAD